MNNLITIVYFHTNGGSFNIPASAYSYKNGIPDYAYITALHNYKILPNVKHILLCDLSLLNTLLISKMSLIGIEIYDFLSFKSHYKFIEFTNAFLASKYFSGLGSFLMNTLARTYFIELLMEKECLHDVIYLEFDVLLMRDISTMPMLFDFKYKTCKNSESESCNGLLYFKDIDTIANLNLQITTILKDKLFKSWISDMTVTAEAVKRLNWNNLCFFNTFPNGNLIVDPCTYGLYLYGTNLGRSPGFLNLGRITDKILKENENNLVFSYGKNAAIELNNKKSNIVSLHVHRKTAIPNIVEQYWKE